MSNGRLERWQDRTDEWLLAAAVIFLIAYRSSTTPAHVGTSPVRSSWLPSGSGAS
jgi:hypothetical protein